MNIVTVQNFHKSRMGYLIFGLAELAVSYLFANAALDSGNLWQWITSLVCLFGFVQNLGRGMMVHTK